MKFRSDSPKSPKILVSFQDQIAAIEKRIAEKMGARSVDLVASSPISAPHRSFGMTEEQSVHLMDMLRSEDPEIAAMMERAMAWGQTQECHEIITKLLTAPTKSAKSEALIELVNKQLTDSDFNIRFTVALLVDLNDVLADLQFGIELEHLVTIPTTPAGKIFTYTDSLLPALKQVIEVVQRLTSAFSDAWKIIQRQIGDETLLETIFPSKPPLDPNRS